MKVNRKKMLFYSTYIPLFSLIGYMVAAAVTLSFPENKTVENVCSYPLYCLGLLCIYMHGNLAIVYSQYLLYMEKPYRRLLFWWFLVMCFPIIVCPILYRRHRGEFEAMLVE